MNFLTVHVSQHFGRLQKVTEITRNTISDHDKPSIIIQLNYLVVK